MSNYPYHCPFRKLLLALSMHVWQRLAPDRHATMPKPSHTLPGNALPKQHSVTFHRIKSRIRLIRPKIWVAHHSWRRTSSPAPHSQTTRVQGKYPACPGGAVTGRLRPQFGWVWLWPPHRASGVDAGFGNLHPNPRSDLIFYTLHLRRYSVILCLCRCLVPRLRACQGNLCAPELPDRCSCRLKQAAPGYDEPLAPQCRAGPGYYYYGLQFVGQLPPPFQITKALSQQSPCCGVS